MTDDSRIEEFIKERNAKRRNIKSSSKIIAKRVCPHCRHTEMYSGNKAICSNCGRRFEVFVIRSASEIKEREKETTEYITSDEDEMQNM